MAKKTIAKKSAKKSAAPVKKAVPIKKASSKKKASPVKKSAATTKKSTPVVKAKAAATKVVKKASKRPAAKRGAAKPTTVGAMLKSAGQHAIASASALASVVKDEVIVLAEASGLKHTDNLK